MYYILQVNFNNIQNNGGLLGSVLLIIHDMFVNRKYLPV